MFAASPHNHIITPTRPALLAFVLLACLLLPGAAPARAQGDISQIDIVRVDASDFPNVTVQARILDAEGLPVQELNPENFILTEDTTEHSFTAEQTDAGLQTALIADLGAGSWAPGATGEPRIEEIKTLLRQYVEAMGPGDRAMVIQQNELGLTVVQAMTPDEATLLHAIDSLDANRTANRLSNTYGAIMQGLDELSSTEAPGQAQAMILFTTGIQLSGPVTYDDVEARLSESNIPVSAVLSNTASIPLGYNLQRVTDMAGGQYVHYTPETSFEPILEIVKEQRLQYALTYRSASGTSDERTVTLETRGSGPNAPRGVGAYSVSVAPPQVVVDSPQDGATYLREAGTPGEPLDEVEPRQINVSAHVEWPDDYPRDVRTAQLLVDEQPYGEAASQPDATLDFTWDVRPFRDEGDNPAQLQVQVVDELGHTSLSEPVDVNIRVRIPQAPPVVEESACANPASASLGVRVSCLVSENNVPLAAVIAAPLILIAVAGWFGRGLLLSAATGIDRAILDALRSMTHPVETPHAAEEQEEEAPEAAAYLTVKRGEPGIEGSRFPLFSGHITPIGCDEEQASVVVSAVNGAIIGRKHCEVRHEDDRFNLRDFASKSGTYLNGVRMDELAIAPLEDGDEIGLGLADEDGVILRFEEVGKRKRGRVS